MVGFVRSVRQGFVAIGVAGFLLACASTNADVTRRSPEGLPRPDRVQVRDFAVTLEVVALDSGIGPGLAREAMGEATSQEEVAIGRAAADALAAELVRKLAEYGIAAERGKRGSEVGPNTLVIVGRFVSLDEGNQTLRTLIGFGAGASEVRTEARAYMRGQLVASAMTIAEGNKKPGAAVTLGAGAAAGAAATAAVMATGTTVASELSSSVKADVKRTGAALAKQIHEGYVSRGWLEK